MKIMDWYKGLTPTKKALVIGGILLLVTVVIALIVRASKRKAVDKAKDDTKALPSNANAKGTRKLVVDLEQSGTVHDLPAVERAEIGKWRDRIFESERWMKELPPLTFPLKWKVQIVPPYGNAVVRFFVFNQKGNKVSVMFDPYELHSLDEKERSSLVWDIYCSELTEREVTVVGLNDMKALKQAIQDMLDRAEAQSVGNQ